MRKVGTSQWSRCLLSSDAVHDMLTRLHSNSLQPPGGSCHCFSQPCFTLIAPSLLCLTVSMTACYNTRWFCLVESSVVNGPLLFKTSGRFLYKKKNWSSTYNGVLIYLSRRKGPILYKVQMAREAKFCIALSTTYCVTSTRLWALPTSIYPTFMVKVQKYSYTGPKLSL